MSTSYSTVVIVGVQVDRKSLYEEYMAPGHGGCRHQFTTKFCPQCGSSKPKDQKQERFKADVWKMLGWPSPETFDDAMDDDHDLWSNGHLTLKEYGDCGGNKILLVGVTVAKIADQRGGNEPFHRSGTLPLIPTQEELEATLKADGLPFKEGTYGVHTVTEAW